MAFIRKKAQISKRMLDGLAFFGQRLFPQQSNLIKVARTIGNIIIDKNVEAA